MSRKIAFTVTLTFESKITDDKDILEIANNIARAIKNEANNGQGIVTDFSDTYTETIMVKPIGMDEAVTINVLD
jgi:hypothetical protein